MYMIIILIIVNLILYAYSTLKSISIINKMNIIFGKHGIDKTQKIFRYAFMPYSVFIFELLYHRLKCIDGSI